METQHIQIEEFQCDSPASRHLCITVGWSGAEEITEGVCAGGRIADADRCVVCGGSVLSQIMSGRSQGDFTTFSKTLRRLR